MTRSSSTYGKVIKPFKFCIWICTCCYNVLACVVSHFVFHRAFPHSNFVIVSLLLSIYACASSLIDRAEWVHEMSWLGQASQHGKTGQLAFSSPHVIVKQYQQSLLLIAVLVLKLCRIAYRATNEPAHLM